jgi:CBS domain-containing protein
MEGDVRTWPLIGVPEKATLPEAATVMSDRGISVVGVFDTKHNLLGIVTERDLTWVIAQAKDTSSLSVVDVMNDYPVLLDAPVTRTDVADAMRRSHIRHVIVRENATDYRIVSIRDLLDEADEGSAEMPASLHTTPTAGQATPGAASPIGSVPVRTVMTAPAAVCYEQDDLEMVARMLTDREVSGLPVLSREGKVVGVVSEADVARALGAPILRLALHPQHSGPFLRETQVPGPHTAAEVMSSPPVVAHPDTPLHTVAEIMIKKSVNRLPVVDHEQLVGIVSRGDVLAALARTAG